MYYVVPTMGLCYIHGAVVRSSGRSALPGGQQGPFWGQFPATATAVGEKGEGIFPRTLSSSRARPSTCPRSMQDGNNSMHYVIQGATAATSPPFCLGMISFRCVLVARNAFTCPRDFKGSPDNDVPLRGGGRGGAHGPGQK